MMVKREVIDTLGGFDENFGMWGFEDDDYSVRARCAGYRLRIARDCFIRHLGSQTAKTANLDYTRLLLENFEYFKKKWGLPPEQLYGPIDFETLGKQAFDAERDVSEIVKTLANTAPSELKLLVTAA
jgi:GT2 family glycosyltransferase